MSKGRFREIKVTVTKLVHGRTGICLPGHLTEEPDPSIPLPPLVLHWACLEPDKTEEQGRGSALCIKVTWLMSEPHRFSKSFRSSSSNFYPHQRFSLQQSRYTASQPVLELFLNEEKKEKKKDGKWLWLWSHFHINIHPVFEFLQQRSVWEQLCKQPRSGWIHVFPPAEPGPQERPDSEV